MTDKEKIIAEIERLKDIQSSPIELCNDLISFIDSLSEVSVSEDLEEAADKYCNNICNIVEFTEGDSEEEASDREYVEQAFKAGANWQKQNLWKDAQGDELPEINREVIALQGRKVVFAHRPNPEGWDGKSLSTGEVEHYTPMIYGKGGWNMEGVTYWLDAPLPEGIE